MVVEVVVGGGGDGGEEGEGGKSERVTALKNRTSHKG